MALTRITGIVSGVKELEDQAGFKYLSFRIGNRPVTTYIKMNVMENDRVTAVGEDTPEPRIEALRNDITKVEYTPADIPAKIPVAMTIIGIILIPLLFIGVVVLFFAWSGYFSSKKINARAQEIKKVLKGA